MPGGVCKTIICGGPWAGVMLASEALLGSDNLSDPVKQCIDDIHKQAEINWTMVGRLSINATNERALAVEEWSRRGAKAATDLLLHLTEGN